MSSWTRPISNSWKLGWNSRHTLFIKVAIFRWLQRGCFCMINDPNLSHVITLQNHATATFTTSLRVLRMTKVLRTSRVVLLRFGNKNNGLRRITVFCFHIDDSRDLFVFLQCPAATVSLPKLLFLPYLLIPYHTFCSCTENTFLGEIMTTIVFPFLFFSWPFCATFGRSSNLSPIMNCDVPCTLKRFYCSI